MKALLSRKSLSGAHIHQWYYRERPATMGKVITGYVCRCGKVDYVDLVGGISSGKGEFEV